VDGDDSALSGRGIGNFTENGRRMRTGCVGEIARALMESFIREQREGEGFFGIFWDAKL